MKRKHQSPLEYSRQHCKERAQERYGFTLFDNDYDDLSNRIREHFVEPSAPKYPEVNREGSQFTLIVPLRGRKLVAVFDVESATLKTFLPPEQFSEHLS